MDESIFAMYRRSKQIKPDGNYIISYQLDYEDLLTMFDSHDDKNPLISSFAGFTYKTEYYNYTYHIKI